MAHPAIAYLRDTEVHETGLGVKKQAAGDAPSIEAPNSAADLDHQGPEAAQA